VTIFAQAASDSVLRIRSMSIATAPGFTHVIHIRRLSSAGSLLYVRIGSSDISRLGLRHGQAIEIDLGRALISGIVKTSGGSPWLAPALGSSNAAITATLRGAGFEHGMDVSATARALDASAESSGSVKTVPAHTMVRAPVRSQSRCDLRIDSKDAVQAICDYNRGFYRGRRNIDLDREAYDRFRNGLSNDLQQLINQLAFVGEQYGGAQERFLPHDIPTEAGLIAPNLHRVISQWLKTVTDAKPLIGEVPNESTLAFLFSPFTATKQWGVWASKTLHFLRPDVFPILDSNAKKPLRLNCGSSSRDYHRFCSCLREVLQANAEALAAARAADISESSTDLKLLDKILFQLGMSSRSDDGEPRPS
jgi:hypothetical protein